MPVTFDNNHTRLVTPTLYLPGQSPEGYRRAGKIYPIDDVTKRLVEVIARKGWDIPGIDVKFHTYGPNNAPLTIVEEISGGTPGHKWRVHFGRKQFTSDFSDRATLTPEQEKAENLGSWNLTTAADEVCIPQQKFILDDDLPPVKSHPVLYVYAGDDYDQHEKGFMAGPVLNKPENNNPTPCFRYNFHDGDMVHDAAFSTTQNDEQKISKYVEPTIPIQAMFENASGFINNIIDQIDQLPDHSKDPQTRLKELMGTTFFPVPAGTPKLYVAERPGNRSTETDTLVLGTGFRLCDIGIGNDPNHPFPQEAHNGYSYGYTSLEKRRETRLPAAWQDINDNRILIYEVMLKRANDIYVVDEAVAQAIGDDEDRRVAIAKTLVP